MGVLGGWGRWAGIDSNQQSELFFVVVVFQALICVQLFTTPWTVAHQAPLSMEFSRQEYWSELSFPSQGDLPDPGIELRFSALQADSLPSKPPLYICRSQFIPLPPLPPWCPYACVSISALQIGSSVAFV